MKFREALERRFPDCGTNDLLSRVAHLLDPQLKGVVLFEFNLYEKTKEEMVEKWSVVINPEEEEINPPVDENLSSVEKLLKKRNQLGGAGSSRGQIRDSQLGAELVTYESFSPVARGTDILVWWRDHKEAMPTLGKIIQEVCSV